MFRICLVNMPFSNLALPSIALTQIKSVVDAKFKDKVAVDIQYLSHDVAKFLNVDFYGFLATSMESLNTGLETGCSGRQRFQNCRTTLKNISNATFPPGQPKPSC